MTARILIVDDVETNIKVLEAKLEKEYYVVLSALSGEEAIKTAREKQPDIILLDVMMPDMDGFEVCEHLKANDETENIPIIFVTALDDVESKIKGLNYGVEDFLSKPINDIALFTRLKSLSRLKIFSDELRMRNRTNEEIDNNLDTLAIKQYINNFSDAKVIVVDDDTLQSEQINLYLQDQVNEIIIYNDNIQEIMTGINNDIDLIIINMQSSTYDGLRLCSQLRSNHNIKNIPILMLIDEESTSHLVKGMEIGANDYLTIPVNQQELVARARLQIRKKRHQDVLYNNLMDRMKMAITDPLTKCYNRFYFDTHLKNKIIETQTNHHHKLALIMFDIDFFKKINDTFGHLVGDSILQQLSQLIINVIRASDLLVRFGGEEFIILLSDAVSVQDILQCANRILDYTATHNFIADNNRHNITISIGVSILNGHDDMHSLIKRADKNLYAAKNTGRNRIVSDD